MSEKKANPPNAYLFGWAEILEALGLPNGQTNRRRVANLNRQERGPIRNAGQGTQPRCDRDELLDWWNSLGRRWGERCARIRDRKASVASSYKHGREGVVYPELNGSLTRRP